MKYIVLNVIDEEMQLKNEKNDARCKTWVWVPNVAL